MKRKAGDTIRFGIAIMLSLSFWGAGERGMVDQWAWHANNLQYLA